MIERFLSALDEIASKTMHIEEGDGMRKRTLNEVKPVENLSKNPQIFLKISAVQKEAFPSDNCKTINTSNGILSD